jgi:hypothetical protein
MRCFTLKLKAALPVLTADRLNLEALSCVGLQGMPPLLMARA